MRCIWAAGLGLALAWQTPVFAQDAPPARPETVAPWTSDGGSIPVLQEAVGDTAPGDSGSRFYVRTEYLLWWIKNPANPPLVTTAPAGATAADVTLGSPGVTVLNGGTVDYDPESGFRVTAGFWLDDCRHTALETTFFTLGPQNKPFNASSDGSTVIARPVFLQGVGESDEVTAGLGLSSGSIAVRNTARLWGLEENLRCNLCCGCNYRLDFLAGVRYLEIDEGLTITENIVAGPLAVVPPAGTQATAYDEFSTRNQFYGGQVGLDYETHWGRWFLDARGKVALGDTHEILKIEGSQISTPPGGPTTTSTGGLLALPSNIGIYHRDRFAVLPELTLNVGYEVTQNVRAFIGYNFLYLSNILSPGDQIDRVLNESEIPNAPPSPMVPGPIHPLVPFKQTDFWAQGLNFGLEFSF